jgi:hypothetical protein
MQQFPLLPANPCTQPSKGFGIDTEGQGLEQLPSPLQQFLGQG